MAQRYGLSWILMLLCVPLVASAANALWVKDGIPVGSAVGEQTHPCIVPDGAGGAMIIWRDGRNGETDIYGNRVGANGFAYAGSGGLPICSAADDQYMGGAVADGNGAVIVVWTDYRSGTLQLYAQKIDTTGSIHWTADGINICLFASYPWDPVIVSDGAGGAIITWGDFRNGNNDIYAQRVAGNGTLLWGDAGRPVCTVAGDQMYPKIAPDRWGGAIVAWEDGRSGTAIYAQRLDQDGVMLWDTAGVAVRGDVGGGAQKIQIVTNNGGKPYIAWEDQRSGYDDVYVQYLDLNGVPVWPADGVSVCDDLGFYYSKYYPQVVSDDLGGAIVAWWDLRVEEENHVYGQRITWDGTRAWGSMGKVLIRAYGLEGPFSMISDGAGGAILGVDLYPDENTLLDIYAQKVDINGNLLWGSRGAPVSTAESYQYSAKLIHDGFGGLLFAWEDYRPDDISSDIYCQRLSASGLWGNPEPEILSCADVPADQGGWVRITTAASPLDAVGESIPIFGYNVWRLIESGGPMAASPGAASMDGAKVRALLSDPATAKGVRASGPLAAAMGLPEGDWESVGFWFATRDTIYRIAVPTRNDSTEAGPAEETYIVTAHTSTAGIFVASEPATGYSVDNLAPGMTGGFAGDEVVSPPGLMLSWDPNAASDIWKYNVHRGEDAIFEPDETNVVGTTTDTELHDGTWAKAYQYFYKLVAVDRHGNKGPAALLAPEDINVGTMLQSFAVALTQSGIEVTWTLSELDETSTLEALRSTGGSFEQLTSIEIEREGLSFRVVDRSVEPGTTYRYRIDVAEASGIRTLFITDAISTPSMPLTLHQNYPNPFNPSTAIRYYLPEPSEVTLEIYDSSGRLVSRPVDRLRQEKGAHEAAWSGVDASGRAASSGVYFYRLTCGKETLSRKMVLLR